MVNVGQETQPSCDVESQDRFNGTFVKCCQDWLVDLKFREFSEKAEALPALWENGFSVWLEGVTKWPSGVSECTARPLIALHGTLASCGYLDTQAEFDALFFFYEGQRPQHELSDVTAWSIGKPLRSKVTFCLFDLIKIISPLQFNSR